MPSRDWKAPGESRGPFLLATMQLMHRLAISLLLPLVLGACAGPAAEPTPPSDERDRGPVPGDMFAQMVDDAAGRAGVVGSQVGVVISASVTWRDGSLGCPEPGMMYTQALVPGYRVVLSVGDEQYAYHADRQGHFAFCPPDRADDPAPAHDT
ncbi:hypothetical protein BH23CHL7_BH23CHL7_05910 [soil metagenome]